MERVSEVTVERFRLVLRDAVAQVAVVRPVELQVPISLWLRGVVEQSMRENWTTTLGYNTVPSWEAAQAILAEAERQGSG